MPTPPDPNSKRQQRLRNHACGRKIPFSQTTAERIAEQLRSNPSHVRNKWLIAYKCPYGDHWHVGHQKKNW